MKGEASGRLCQSLQALRDRCLSTIATGVQESSNGDTLGRPPNSVVKSSIFKTDDLYLNSSLAT